MDTHKPGLEIPPTITPRPLLTRIARPLAISILSLASSTVLLAQEPFAQDIVPTFSFSEHYVEVLQSIKVDDITETSVVPSPTESKLTATAKLSASGIDINSFNANTPFAFIIGDFEVSGVLGDDPSYTPDAKSIRIPVMDEDFETGEPIEVGRAVISWNDKEINADILVQRPETYQAFVSTYIGSDGDGDGEKVDDTTMFSFTLADREFLDRTVYVKGNADVKTKTIGTGDDEEDFDLSTVKVSGAIDSVRPSVKILGPKDNQIVDSAAITVSAKVSDNRNVFDVQLQLNDEEYVSIYEDDDGNWTSDQLELAYGDNVIRVKATDEDGVESIIKETRIRRWAPLVVNISGKGTVTKGFNGTSVREPGADLTIKAVPNSGYIFAGWSGGSTSADATLTFEMQPGLVLTANFIENPFTAVKGSYSGLLSPAMGSTGTGAFDVQLTGTGSFTAKVALNGRTENLVGNFDSTGHFSGTLNLGNSTPLNVELQLGFGDDANTISGTLSDGTTTININGERSTYTNKDAAPEAGSYTLALPASVLPGTPQGQGYATLKVGKTGSATLAGALGDGTAFTYGGSVSRNGTLGVYFTPYGGKGIVFGTIKIYEEGTSNPNDLDGTLSWIKLSGATTDGFYPTGFETTTELLGSRYEAPGKKERILALANTTSNTKVSIGEGGISPITRTDITLTTGNSFTIPAGLADKLKVKVTPAKGLFSGSFIDSTGTTRKFDGVFLRKQNYGAGVFRGANTAGYISITAP